MAYEFVDGVKARVKSCVIVAKAGFTTRWNSENLPWYINSLVPRDSNVVPGVTRTLDKTRERVTVARNAHE